MVISKARRKTIILRKNQKICQESVITSLGNEHQDGELSNESKLTSENPVIVELSEISNSRTTDQEYSVTVTKDS